MNPATMKTCLRAAVVCISVTFSNAALPHGGMMMGGGGEMPHGHAVQFLAWVTAFGEMCQTKFPDMKEAIAASSVKGLDAPTLEWKEKLKQSPEFESALASMRSKIQMSADGFSKQCQETYGNQSKLSAGSEHHHP